MKEYCEMNNQVLQCGIELNDEVDMELTEDEKIARGDAWHIHCKRDARLKNSRVQVYSLVLGQCTQVLVDKMRQDDDWGRTSESCVPLSLFKLIKKSVLEDVREDYGDTLKSSKMSGTHLEAFEEDSVKKFVLKQSENQYKTGNVTAEQLPTKLFLQEYQVGSGTYDDRCTPRLEVACQAGVC
jgi:hypothetical protein